MAPKKKKSGKLSKMSEEDRIIYMEQQRLAEEEMEKKKQDVLMQFLKDKLNKEEKATKLNLHKLNHQWRNIMRECKSKELKKDIEILSQTFERVVDRKESVIKSLVKDLMEAEEQYAMAMRSHLMNIDNLVDIQRMRVDKLMSEFEAEQDILIAEFDTEDDLLVGQHERDLSQLQDVVYAMEQNYMERETEAKTEFHSMRDEIKNKNREEMESLRVQHDTTAKFLWSQFQLALKNYQETTEERKKVFEELKMKDEKSAREIEMQMRKLQRIADNIAQVKTKMNTNSKECEERNKHLKEERERMLQHFQLLKGEMNKLREIERGRLTKLTLESSAAIKEIKRKSLKGEMILKLGEKARRYETEAEKVLPFYACSLTQEEQEDVTSAELDTPMEALAAEMYEYRALENFWKRYNKVLLDKVAMERERQCMQQENEQLRTLLKQYLDGISVNDEILSQVNPLFVVNHRTNLKLSNVPVMEPRVRRADQPVVLEAAHVVKNILPP